MKLDTSIEAHQRNCRMEEQKPITSNYRVIFLPNFLNKLVQYCMKLDTLIRGPSEEVQNAKL